MDAVKKRAEELKLSPPTFRTGFAKVAGLTQVPIIPVYTENIRLAYKTMNTGASLYRLIFFNSYVKEGFKKIMENSI